MDPCNSRVLLCVGRLCLRLVLEDAEGRPLDEAGRRFESADLTALSESAKQLLPEEDDGIEAVGNTPGESDRVRFPMRMFTPERETMLAGGTPPTAAATTGREGTPGLASPARAQRHAEPARADALLDFSLEVPRCPKIPVSRMLRAWETGQA